MNTGHTMPSYEEAWIILGLQPEASAEDIRQAYLEKMKQFPPDRAPVEFERIRDAYDQLRKPGIRLQSLLAREKEKESLADHLDEAEFERAFTGPEMWLAVIKEK